MGKVVRGKKWRTKAPFSLFFKERLCANFLCLQFVVRSVCFLETTRRIVSSGGRRSYFDSNSQFGLKNVRGK